MARNGRVFVDQGKIAEFCRRHHIRKLSFFGPLEQYAKLTRGITKACFEMKMTLANGPMKGTAVTKCWLDTELPQEVKAKMDAKPEIKQDLPEKKE